MASLGRSFKPPAYFSRTRRPAMPGRTLSNSSDVSVASASSRSDDHCDLLMSGLNTPAQEKTGFDSLKLTTAPELCSPRGNSRPITIELPHSLRKINSAPTHTPPEPLSARGDVPGGYFPLHEDPKARIHRTHPFHADGGPLRHHSVCLTRDSSSHVEPHGTPLPILMAPSTHLSPSMALESDPSRSNTPVASYLPSGIHDTPLPMGKYYPSNYESRGSQDPTRIGPSAPHTRASSTRSGGHIPTREGFRSSRQDSEVRRKLQQYQRDMIAQARLAASEVLGGAASQSTVTSSSTVNLNGVPLTSLHHIGTSGSHKPISPRLLPLGSPGPVTPMNLEGEDVGYLDGGRNDEIARVLRAEEERIRREGATSPAVETGPQAF
ncbi:hypothetical protein GCG54_00012569 [Colletotrichum gloeosporioides]|uniref:Uncharacterized protein n=1 Tax=Colletotrichum gloeosporioides TaxID=474922 RepID=A0A8H4CEK2_COLGL|nr:uncharacterized protein GCG54_00012569 [Colletotrichum gloeosporioides]KAF3802321.1 hypothetical protein GCG54_00012569 [Colletotrichum gloeosporioides]